MALPRVNETLNFSMTIPSTGEKVKYRPYLVKEEKVLLQAFESQSTQLIVESMCNTIETCLDPRSEVKVADLATFDVEYMFLQIRSASVGESSTVVMKCDNCEAENEVNIDLTSIEIDVKETDNVIEITDDISVEMRYPSYANVNFEEEEDTDQTAALFKVVAASVAAVLTDEERIEIGPNQIDEVLEFLDSLTATQFKKITSHLEDLPSLKHDVEFECKECETKNEVELSGLADFFS